MARVLAPNFARPDVKTKSLVQRMARFDLEERIELITNTFDVPVFRTRFGLADQVLLHAVVSSNRKIAIHDALEGVQQDQHLKSLRNISRDLYGVSFEKTVPDAADVVLASNHVSGIDGTFIGKDVESRYMLINPIADWSSEQLVSYVLAHEVPVNPHDMPGYTSRVA